MGYYDQGTYSSNGYNADQERQSARDRYLDLLTKQRLNNQAMIDQMNRVEENKRAAAERDESGARAVKGAEIGLAASGGNPYGALAGGLLGKGSGSLEYGARHGVVSGILNFLNPMGELHALMGSGSQSGNAGSGLANQVGGLIQDRKKRSLEDTLRREKMLRASNTGYRDAPGVDNTSFPETTHLGGINDPDMYKSIYEADDTGSISSRLQPSYYGEFDDPNNPRFRR